MSKLSDMFNKLVSNDNVKPSEVKNKQKKVIALSAATFAVLVVAGTYFTTDKQEIPETVKGFSVLVDESKDNIARNKWVKDGARNLTQANQELKSIKESNARLSKELQELKKEISNVNKKTEADKAELKKISQEEYLKILQAGSNIKAEQEKAKKRIQEEQNSNQTQIPGWVKDNASANSSEKAIKPSKNEKQEIKKIEYPKPIQDEYYYEEIPLNNSLFFQTIEQPNKESKVEEEKKEEEIVEIPATSIIKAALISGFDAPTLAQAKSSPAPLLLRITDLSILANNRHQDLRKCFLLAEGYGDLASERAYLRTNTISCINANNDNIVSDFTAFVAGEDGKNGLRGRVVTKQGAIIGRTLISGVLQGIGEAFGSDGKVSIIGDSGITSHNDNSSLSASQIANKALGIGISRASEKLADFYLKMADQISPVIEISAGREVDVIVTKTVKINLSETKKYKADLNRSEENE